MAEHVSLIFHSVLSKLYAEPSISSSYQISVHLAIRFQRRRLYQKSTNQKKELPVVAFLLTDRD